MTARSLLWDTDLLEDTELPLVADVRFRDEELRFRDEELRFRDEELPARVPDCDITSERDRELGVETVPLVLVRELPAAAMPDVVAPVAATPEEVVLLRDPLSITAPVAAVPVVAVLPRDEPVVTEEPLAASEPLLTEPEASVLDRELPDVE